MNVVFGQVVAPNHREVWKGIWGESEVFRKNTIKISLVTHFLSLSDSHHEGWHWPWHLVLCHLHCLLLVVARLKWIGIGGLDHLGLVVERLQLVLVSGPQQASPLPHAWVGLEQKWRRLEKRGVGREERRGWRALEQRIGDCRQLKRVFGVRSWKGRLRSELLEDVGGRIECSRLGNVWSRLLCKVGQGWLRLVGRGWTAHQYWQLGCFSLQGKQPGVGQDGDQLTNEQYIEVKSSN